ncbi:MAG: class I SAM-dependent methyltransferase [Methanomicrobiales archaeon]|nr:class I SAM-dependent methyltransferase [Methanomicrobiales archaeon]
MPLTVFEKYAERYDQWFVDYPDVYQEELNRIKKAIGTVLTPALEIGVGSGRFAEPLSIESAIEPSLPLGLMAKKRGIEIIQGIGESIPLKSRIFQTVVMITVLCFLKIPDETFREVHRILMHDGTLLVAFIEKGGTIAQTYLTRPDKGMFLSHARFYTQNEVISMINRNGFVLKTVDCRMGFCILVFRKDE